MRFPLYVPMPPREPHLADNGNVSYIILLLPCSHFTPEIELDVSEMENNIDLDFDPDPFEMARKSPLRKRQLRKRQLDNTLPPM